MKRKIVFTHIPKTAGTSFKEEVIKKNYPQVFNLRGRLSLLRAFLQKPPFLTGHVPFGPVNRYMRNSYEHLTFFRDPVERAISHYYFILESKSPDYEHPRYKVCRNHSLAEVYRSGEMPDNLQTRYIAGCRDDSLPCNGAMLAKAKYNLERFYPVFGIQEQYDASIEIICNYYDFPIPMRKERTHYKKTHAKPEVDTHTRELLDSLHFYDFLFYQFVLEKFAELKKRIGTPSQENHEC